MVDFDFSELIVYISSFIFGVLLLTNQFKKIDKLLLSRSQLIKKEVISHLFETISMLVFVILFTFYIMKNSLSESIRYELLFLNNISTFYKVTLVIFVGVLALGRYISSFFKSLIFSGMLFKLLKTIYLIIKVRFHLKRNQGFIDKLLFLSDEFKISQKIPVQSSTPIKGLKSTVIKSIFVFLRNELIISALLITSFVAINLKIENIQTFIVSLFIIFAINIFFRNRYIEFFNSEKIIIKDIEYERFKTNKYQINYIFNEKDKVFFEYDNIYYHVDYASKSFVSYTFVESYKSLVKKVDKLLNEIRKAHSISSCRQKKYKFTIKYYKNIYKYMKKNKIDSLKKIPSEVLSGYEKKYNFNETIKRYDQILEDLEK